MRTRIFIQISLLLILFVTVVQAQTEKEEIVNNVVTEHLKNEKASDVLKSAKNLSNANKQLEVTEKESAKLKKEMEREPTPSTTYKYNDAEKKRKKAEEECKKAKKEFEKASHKEERNPPSKEKQAKVLDEILSQNYSHRRLSVLAEAGIIPQMLYENQNIEDSLKGIVVVSNVNRVCHCTGRRPDGSIIHLHTCPLYKGATGYTCNCPGRALGIHLTSCQFYNENKSVSPISRVTDGGLYSKPWLKIKVDSDILFPGKSTTAVVTLSGLAWLPTGGVIRLTNKTPYIIQMANEVIPLPADRASYRTFSHTVPIVALQKGEFEINARLSWNEQPDDLVKRLPIPESMTNLNPDELEIVRQAWKTFQKSCEEVSKHREPMIKLTKLLPEKEGSTTQPIETKKQVTPQERTPAQPVETPTTQEREKPKEGTQTKPEEPPLTTQEREKPKEGTPTQPVETPRIPVTNNKCCVISSIVKSAWGIDMHAVSPGQGVSIWKNNTIIPLIEQASDRDQIQQICVCLINGIPQPPSGKPVNIIDSVNYKWTLIIGGGHLFSTVGPATLYQPPDIEVGESREIMIKAEVSDVRGNDKSPEDLFIIKIERLKECLYRRTIRIISKRYAGEFAVLFTGSGCLPQQEQWDVPQKLVVSDIIPLIGDAVVPELPKPESDDSADTTGTGSSTLHTVTRPPSTTTTTTDDDEAALKLCAGERVILVSRGTDTDILTLICEGDCGNVRNTAKGMIDEIYYTWSTTIGGFPDHGASPTTNSGYTSAIYKAPDGPGKGRIDLNARDSLAQAVDKKLSKKLKVKIYKVDLKMQCVSDDEEECRGGIIPLNDDNDNWNKKRDDEKDEFNVKGEDDLVPITLTKEPKDGKVELDATSGKESIRVWETSTKDKGTEVLLPKIYPATELPKMLYVEGLKVSKKPRDVELVLKSDIPPCQDKVKATVIDLEFVECDEIEYTDILPLFNPNPILTIKPVQNLGNAEQVSINISGTVKDYIAPVDKVLVNGTEVKVTQTSSGKDGLGPYEGTFETKIDITGRDTLIEALAINSLNNIGKAFTLINVTRNPATFDITSRVASAPRSVPEPPADETAFLDAYRFKIRLEHAEIVDDEVQVEFNTGIETKVITLKRVNGSNIFESKNLYLTPKNLKLADSVSAEIKKTRLKSDLGKKPEVTYAQGSCKYKDIGITKGILLLKKGDESITDFVDSATDEDIKAGTVSRSYIVRVGMHGSAGKNITVQLRGTDNVWSNLAQPEPNAYFAPVSPSLTLTRVSDDPASSEYHLYKMDETKPVMGVRSRLPLDASGTPQSNASLSPVFVVFDGALKCECNSLSLTEPVIGIEIVGKTLASSTYMSAGVIPDGNPAPPVISIADGAPRPRVEITSATYAPDPANPRRIRVQGKVQDYIADMISSDKMGGVGLGLEINGRAVPDANITINRPQNDPPRPFLATFDTNVDLAMIPDNTDRDAYRVSEDRASRGNTVAISQEAIIVRATNTLGNFSFDSAFARIVDTNGADPAGDITPPYSVAAADGGGIINGRENLPTNADIEPDKFFVMYHNPFKTEQNFSDLKLKSKLENKSDLYSKKITIERKLWGNIYLYGPFISGTVHRSVRNAPAIDDAIPVMPMIKFTRNANGNITSRDIGVVLEVNAPDPCREDICECVPLDLKLDSPAAGDDNRDEYLPEGTDATPVQLRVVAQISPTYLSLNRNVTFSLFNTTNFRGHCGNAPRPGTPGLDKDDFSFNNGGNDTGPTAQVAFNARGEASNVLFSKDFGGRTVVQAQINLPGNPRVLMEVPLDSDGDFLPDVWEARFRATPGTNPDNPVRDGLVDDEDRDLTGANTVHNESGDGFTALEEYRGFQVTTNAGARVLRMDEIPFAYGGAPRGNAANGTLIAGPKVKDILVFHQSTMDDSAAGNLTLGTTNPPLYNLAWHKIREADLSANQPAATYQGHDHRVNFNGDNDGFDVVQNALHIRDHNTLPAADQLPASVLGSSGSFSIDGTDIRINSAGAGARFGFTAPLRNGNIIFHEVGHKFSERHCVGSTSQGAAVFTSSIHAANNNDVDGDGVADGVIRVVISTYLPQTFPAGTIVVRGMVINPSTGMLAEGVQFTVNGAVQTPTSYVVSARDAAGTPQDIILVFASSPIPAGAAIGVRGPVLWPDLMDWTPFYMGPNGLNLQQNLNGPQFVLPGQKHSGEVRIKSRP